MHFHWFLHPVFSTETTRMISLVLVDSLQTARLGWYMGNVSDLCFLNTR